MEACILHLLELLELLVVFFIVEGILDRLNRLVALEQAIDHLILWVLDGILANVQMLQVLIRSLR